MSNLTEKQGVVMENPKFTEEQQDWICYQIGEWYFHWKGKMFEDDRTHHLGTATEELKTMICDGLTIRQWLEKHCNKDK